MFTTLIFQNTQIIFPLYGMKRSLPLPCNYFDNFFTSLCLEFILAKPTLTANELFRAATCRAGTELFDWLRNLENQQKHVKMLSKILNN